LFNSNRAKRLGVLSPDAHGVEQGILILSEDYLSDLYPQKVIRRILYLPLNNRWYPFADVQASNKKGSQLTLFYDTVHFSLSKNRICCLCERPLSRLYMNKSDFPLGLCEICKSKIVYNYFDCLEDIYRSSLQRVIQLDNSDRGIASCICSNLLEPRCGLPLSFERTNSCLKDHAIAIIFKDFSTIQVRIGLKATLKYKVLRDGGIFSVIFGMSYTILNIEKLGSILCNIFEELLNFTMNFNETREPSDNFTVNLDFARTSENVIKKMMESILLLQFLEYYQDHRAKLYLESLFGDIINFFLQLIGVMHKKFNFIILDYIELYKKYPPLNLELRFAVERYFEQELGIRSIEELFKLNFTELNLKLKRGWNTYLESARFFTEIEESLEIYKVYAALGSSLLIQSDLYTFPIFITIRECIGRLFQ